MTHAIGTGRGKGQQTKQALQSMRVVHIAICNYYIAICDHCQGKNRVSERGPSSGRILEGARIRGANRQQADSSEPGDEFDGGTGDAARSASSVKLQYGISSLPISAWC